LRISHWVIGAAVLAASPAGAEPLAVQPGLWQGTVNAEGGGTSNTLQQLLQGQIARLKPEQQAKLQGVLAAAGGAALTRQFCITPALLQRDLSGPGGKGRCSRTVVSRSATALDLQVSCSGHDRVDGTLRLTAADPKTVTGTIDAQLTTKDGATLPLHRTLEGHWLAADCGGVKPVE
jgi:hypothetical protein